MFQSLFPYRAASIKSKTQKTHDQVEGDLIQSICEQANASLATASTISRYLICTLLTYSSLKPIVLDDPPSTENLQCIFTQIAHKKFHNEYGYSYDGGNSTPLDQSPDSAVLSTAKSLYVIRDDVTNRSTVISKFVEEEILAYV